VTVATDPGSDRPLLDKLGVKPGMRVSVLGLGDQAFVRDLEDRGADVSRRLRKDTDLVFVVVGEPAGLAKLARLEPSMRRNGAVWVLYARGRKDLREVDVIRAGLDAGFVDNKIARFSDHYTSMRLVIPVARR
jgi:hypothetical protein